MITIMPIAIAADDLKNDPYPEGSSFHDDRNPHFVVAAFNHTDEPLVIEKGDRIAWAEPITDEHCPVNITATCILSKLEQYNVYQAEREHIYEQASNLNAASRASFRRPPTTPTATANHINRWLQPQQGLPNLKSTWKRSASTAVATVRPSQINAVIKRMTARQIREQLKKGAITPEQVAGSVKIAFVLFSGMGGFTKGLIQDPDVKVFGAIDNNAEALATHKLNFPDIETINHTIGQDHKQTMAIIAEHMPRELWQWAYVHASPPCQGLSSANFSRTAEDVIRALQITDHTLMMLVEARMGAITIEQSPRALSHFKGKMEFVKVMDMQKHCHMHQTRKRLIISNLNLAPTQTSEPTGSIAQLMGITTGTPLEKWANMKQYNRYKIERPATQPGFTCTNRPMRIGVTWEEAEEVSLEVMQRLQQVHDMKFPELTLTAKRQLVADVIPPKFAEELSKWVWQEAVPAATRPAKIAAMKTDHATLNGELQNDIEYFMRYTNRPGDRDTAAAPIEPTAEREEEYRRLRAHREDDRNWPGPDYSNAREPTEKELDEAMNATGVQAREDLDDEQKRYFRDLFRRYFPVWDEHLRKAGPTRGKIRPLRVINHPPRHERNPEKLKRFQEYIYALAKQGSIRPSSSPFSSPAMIIPKPNAKKDPNAHIFSQYRLVVDYRTLNAVILKDRYTPPRVDTCLAALAGSTHRSYLDLTQAFFQIPLADDGVSIESTAISVPGCGSWEWLVMPMGVAVAPAAQQRHMDRVIAGYAMVCAIVFADDLAVFSKSWNQHKIDLENIFKRLHQHGCSVSLKKCLFVKESHVWLGYVIESGKIKPNPKYVEAIRTLVNPRNRKQLQSVIGVLDQLRRFIPNFAIRTRDISNHLKDEKFIGLSTTAAKEYKEIKDEIVRTVQEERALYYPDFTKKLFISCDASVDALGGAAYQEYDSGPDQPFRKYIGFFSRKTKDAEKNYCKELNIPTDKDGNPTTGANTRLIEALSIKWMIDELQDLIESFEEVIIENDHKSLAALAKAMSGKLFRWAIELSRYPHIKIRYAPVEPASTQYAGSSYNTAPEPSAKKGKDEAFVSKNTNEAKPDYEIQNSTRLIDQGIKDTKGLPLPAALEKAQKEDDMVQQIIAHLKLAETTSRKKWNAKTIIAHKRYTYKSPGGEHPKLLYCRIGRQLERAKSTVLIPATVIFVPRDAHHIQQRIVAYLHDSMFAVHPGIKATEAAVRTRYYWPNIKETVHKYVQNCTRCAIAKGTNPKKSGHLMTYMTPGTGHTLCIDVIVLKGVASDNEYGYKAILTMTDRFSGYLKACPLKQQDTKYLCNALLRSWFLTMGAPLKIVADGQFKTHEYQALMSMLQVKFGYTSPYHSQGNPDERQNRTTQERLRVLIHEYRPPYEDPREGRLSTWPDWLDFAVAGINNSPKPDTNITPYALMFGRPYRLPADTMFAPLPGQNAIPSETREYYTYKANLLKDLTSTIADMKMKRDAANTAAYNSKQLVTDMAVGDYCMLFTDTREGKLANRMQGPYVITKKYSAVTYQIKNVKNGNTQGPVHIQRLKQFKGDVVDCDSEGEDPPTEAAEQPNILDTAVGKIMAAKDIIFKDRKEGGIFVARVTAIERATGVIEIHYYRDTKNPGTKHPLEERKWLAPEYTRTTTSRSTGKARNTLIGTFEPLAKEKIHDKAFENTINTNRFDILAAGFELERRRTMNGIFAKIPATVLEGIKAQASMEEKSAYRPTR
eukprot:g1326.t1